jgi:hypothetical protein
MACQYKEIQAGRALESLMLPINITHCPEFNNSVRDNVLTIEGLQYYYIRYFAHIARVPSVCAYLIDNLELQPNAAGLNPLALRSLNSICADLTHSSP